MNLNINTPKNVDFLLIVRGLAAMSVIYWHLVGYLMRDEYFASFFIIPGRLAVWIFFMMSGYLIGHGLIYGRYRQTFKSVVRFWFNRLLRIYPLFITISLVAILMSNPIISLNFITQELLMIQFNNNYSLNGIFWTLGVEIHFYLLAPLMLFGYQAIFGKHSKNWWILYLITLTILLIWRESAFFKNWDMRSILGGISQFAVGIAMAGYKNKILEHKLIIENKNIALLVIATLTVLLIVIFNHNYAIHILTIIFAHAIGVGLITLHILLEEKNLPTNLFTKILMIFGVLSYGTYAWHGLLLNNNILQDNFALHAIASIVLAYVTYKLVEQPILRFKKI